MPWCLENIYRAFREVFTNLEWDKVFEALDVKPLHEGDITDKYEFKDLEAFELFFTILNECKPKNMVIPIDQLVTQLWNNK